MNDNQALSVKNDFLDIYEAVKHYTDDDILKNSEEIFRLHLEKLYQLLSLPVEDYLVTEMLSDTHFKNAMHHLTHIKTMHGLSLEIARAEKIIRAENPRKFMESFPFFPNYRTLARTEAKVAGLSPGERAVFIGCGPLPLSLICFYREMGVRGIGIEKDENYAKLAKQVITTLKLTDYVQIMTGNHYSLPLEEICRLAMVGADAIPKKDIFNHLAKVLPRGSKIAYRIYEKGLRRLVDNKPISELPEGLKEYARIRPEPPVNNTTVFLIKN